MKLIFAQMDLRPEFKDVVKMAFDVVQQELGLTENSTNVLFTLVEPTVRWSRQGDKFGRIVTGGSTEVKVDEDGFIRMEIGADDIKPMIKTFCHEMTHVCQTVSRALVGDDADPLHPYLKWRGEDVTAMKLASFNDFKLYEKLPWEAQAREMADKIMPKVTAEFKRRWPRGLTR